MARITNSTLTSIDINELSSIDINKENLSDKIRIAKDKLLNYYEALSEAIDINFDNDQWIFKDLITYKKVKFNFNKLRERIRFGTNNDIDEIILRLKIWLVDILSENSLGTSYSYYLDVSSFIINTNFYNENKMLELVNNLNQNLLYRDNGSNNYKLVDVKDYRIQRYINSNISFIEVLDIDLREIVEMLNSICNRFDNKQLNRKLPDFRVFLDFKLLLDQWYREAKLNNEKNKLLKFFPLLLWYNVASIIPMRPSEFCLISIDGVFKKDENYYVTFLRLKYSRKKERRNKVRKDTLPIPGNVYELFQEYILLTNENSNRKNMIDYECYIKYSLEKDNVDEEMIFTSYDLNKLIKLFYKDYISEFTNYNSLSLFENNNYNEDDNYIETIENELSSEDDYYCGDRDYILAGDLRHIAIINMMMQGYSEFEIERLAGHITKETQMNYSAHAENWMNVEILKIQNEIILYKEKLSGLKKGIIYDPRSQEYYEKLLDNIYINGDLDKNILGKYNKIKIGYCTEKEMSCPTFNWKHCGCYFCDYWVITEKELEEKRELILQDLNNVYDETKEKLYFLNSLFNVSIKNERENQDMIIKSTTEEIKDGIYRVAKLKELLESKDE